MPITALVIAKRYATLKDLQTFYGYEDLLDFFEIISVNAINEERMYKEIKAENGRRRNY